MAALLVKYPTANAGDAEDMGSIPGSGRSPRGGHGNILQYSCLENPHDQIGGAWWAIVHWVTKSWARLKQLSNVRACGGAHTHTHTRTHTHAHTTTTTEYYSDKKKNKMLLIATQMDLKGIILNEKSQIEKDILYDITYMWNLKNTTNQWEKKQKNKQIHRYRKQTIGKQLEREG